MKLVKVGSDYKLEVREAPHKSRIFKTRYAAIVYARKLREMLRLERLSVAGIGC